MAARYLVDQPCVDFRRILPVGVVDGEILQVKAVPALVVPPWDEPAEEGGDRFRTGELIHRVPLQVLSRGSSDRDVVEVHATNRHHPPVDDHYLLMVAEEKIACSHQARRRNRFGFQKMDGRVGQVHQGNQALTALGHVEQARAVHKEVDRDALVGLVDQRLVEIGVRKAVRGKERSDDHILLRASHQFRHMVAPRVAVVPDSRFGNRRLGKADEMQFLDKTKRRIRGRPLGHGTG